MTKRYVIGLDYGSDSARAVIMDADKGTTICCSTKSYTRWSKGLYCEPLMNQYRQHPLDYIEVLEYLVKNALSRAPQDCAENVVGISFDTTGSTPVLIDKNGTPLALLPEFDNNPNAMFVLWKDHTAIEEAEQINALTKRWIIDYTSRSGGTYSSEWVWAKVLHLLRIDESLQGVAYSWVEHCDWMSALLTGKTKPEQIVRSRCAAGHKAMWSECWEGLPSEEFLTRLDPLLSGFRSKLYNDTQTSDYSVGTLTIEWATRLGLPDSVVVGVSELDCHMGAVGGGITPNILTRIIGTSTCDILITDTKDLDERIIDGICGQVDGSVIPGYIGLEAGQSAFGDVYAWFKNILAWGVDDKAAIDDLLAKLSTQAEKIPTDESNVLATDWFNGRRTPDANPYLKGTITGLTLGTDAPRIFKALVEATAYGSRAIMERFICQGVMINGVIALGGIAQKSPFVMQTMSDVMNVPIKVVRGEQTCAAGAAMYAAVAAGVYSSIEQAQAVMCEGFEKEYLPRKEKSVIYDKLYRKYLSLGGRRRTSIL